jgi:hypothetical protein
MAEFKNSHFIAITSGHYLSSFYSKHDVSETGLCLLQMETAQLDPIDRNSVLSGPEVTEQVPAEDGNSRVFETSCFK